MRLNHKVCGLILAALLVGASAFGADPRGEPEGFKAGLPACYAIWHNKMGWHLRTTTAEKLRHFKGSLKVDGGTFTRVSPFRPEKDGKTEDVFILSPNKKEILFDFKTQRGIDGIDFHVTKDAKNIRLNLLIDGKHQPKKIFIGRKKEHPNTDPFALPAHPNKK